MKREPYSEQHAHFCDCDECINSAPVKLEQDPKTHTIETPFREAKWLGEWRTPTQKSW